MKENLYCVPYNKNIALRKNGISYHCERESSKTSISNNKSASTRHFTCLQCNKEFEHEKGLKIHQSKMKHSNNNILNNIMQTIQNDIKRKRQISPITENKKKRSDHY